MKLHELFDAPQLMTEEQILSAPMHEMVNLPPKNTGLPVVIWVGEVDGQHGPRIKVSNIKGKFAANDNFVMNVDKDPQVMTPKSVKLKEGEVQDVKDWIKLNYDELMALWQHFETGEGDVIELLQQLKKL